MNKGELRTHIKDVLNRTDVTDALVDTFIFQTLSRIQRLLRIPSMEKTATQTVAGGYDGFVIPNDFLEIISIRAQGQPVCRKLEYSEFLALSNVEGTPTVFTREPATNRFVLHPIRFLHQHKTAQQSDRQQGLLRIRHIVCLHRQLLVL